MEALRWLDYDSQSTKLLITGRAFFQVNQQLIQRVFRLRTAVSRLKAEVAKLGGGQDTVEHRKTVSDSISKIQDEAQDIKQQLMQVAPEQKNRQTAKILSDFEVSKACNY